MRSWMQTCKGQHEAALTLNLKFPVPSRGGSTRKGLILVLACSSGSPRSCAIGNSPGGW